MIKFLSPGLFLLGLLSLSLLSAEEENTGLTVSLISEQKTIAPGHAFLVGFHIQHEPGYHTYWQSPGIVGLATQLDWELPEGFQASPLTWPYPERCDMVGHPCHGYHRDVTLLTTITPPATFTGDQVTLTATASWMCCARSCHPNNQTLSLTLPVAKAPSPHPQHQPLILTAQQEVPVPSEHWNLKSAKLVAEQWHLHFVSTNEERPRYFFSSDGQISSDQPQNFITGKEAGEWTLIIAAAEFPPTDREEISHLQGVLQTDRGHHQVSAPFPKP